jgi:hypothetical protein
MNQEELFRIAKVNPNDIIYTPDHIAKAVVDHFNPHGSILDPCKGAGAFLQFMPGADWCEIREGKDFFQYKDHVDWIISNPPYSIFAKWLYHSFEIADNIVYFIPIAKVFNSEKTVVKTLEYGGVKEILFFGVGTKCGFPVGFAAGAVHFQRNYTGGTIWTHNNRLQVTPKGGGQNWLFN